MTHNETIILKAILYNGFSWMDGENVDRAWSSWSHYFQPEPKPDGYMMRRILVRPFRTHHLSLDRAMRHPFVRAIEGVK